MSGTGRCFDVECRSHSMLAHFLVWSPPPPPPPRMPDRRAVCTVPGWKRSMDPSWCHSCRGPALWFASNPEPKQSEAAPPPSHPHTLPGRRCLSLQGWKFQGFGFGFWAFPDFKCQRTSCEVTIVHSSEPTPWNQSQVTLRGFRCVLRVEHRALDPSSEGPHIVDFHVPACAWRSPVRHLLQRDRASPFQVTGVFVERSTSMRAMDEENMMSLAATDCAQAQARENQRGSTSKLRAKYALELVGSQKLR